MRRFMLLLVVVSGLSFGSSQAQVPRLINYQGLLASAGSPASGAFEVTFSLYGSEQGGAVLWSEVQKDVAVTDGAFSVLLGQAEPLPDALFAAGALFLGVRIGNQELTPRLPLVSTAYALRSAVAERVADGAAVQRLNGLTGTVSIEAGPNVSVAQDGGRITISAAGGGTGDITAVLSGSGLTGGSTEGEATLSVERGGIGTPELADRAVTEAKLADGAVTGRKLAADAAVLSLEGLTGGVELRAGKNIKIEVDDNRKRITIEARGDFEDSSIRWKTNVRTLEEALGIVTRLRGVRYDWKESGRPDLGLIAEEVGQVVPEVVAYEEGQAQGVHYAKLTAVLVEAVKAQQQQLEVQQHRVDELETRLRQLERLVLQAAGTDRAAHVAGGE